MVAVDGHVVEELSPPSGQFTNGAIYDAAFGNGRFDVLGTNFPAAVGARLLEDGTLDKAFGSAGYATVSRGGESYFPAAVAAMSDGSSIFVGSGSSSGNRFEFIAKLTPLGELDLGFGDGGLIRSALSAAEDSDGPFSVATSPGVVVTVEVPSGAGTFELVGRSGTSGALLWTTRLPESRLYSSGSRSVVADGAGHFLFAAFGSDQSEHVFRFQNDGILDSTFGIGGDAAITLPTELTIMDLAVSRSGDILLLGAPTSPTEELDLLRVSAEGILQQTIAVHHGDIGVRPVRLLLGSKGIYLVGTDGAAGAFVERLASP